MAKKLIPDEAPVDPQAELVEEARKMIEAYHAAPPAGPEPIEIQMARFVLKNKFDPDKDGDLHNKANYVDLLQGYATVEEANEKIQAFQEELYRLRNKYRVPDVHVIMKCELAEPDGRSLMLSFHFGMGLHEEKMTAWAFGQAQARRQESVQKLASDLKTLKKLANKK